jgi:hypothetical protein
MESTVTAAPQTHKVIGYYSRTGQSSLPIAPEEQCSITAHIQTAEKKAASCEAARKAKTQAD